VPRLSQHGLAFRRVSLPSIPVVWFTCIASCLVVGSISKLLLSSLRRYYRCIPRRTSGTLKCLVEDLDGKVHVKIEVKSVPRDGSRSQMS
jgi:hypothetical protein